MRQWIDGRKKKKEREREGRNENDIKTHATDMDNLKTWTYWRMPT